MSSPNQLLSGSIPHDARRIECECEPRQPAVLRTTKNPQSQHFGRKFFCCPDSSPKDEDKGCKFYKWADEVNQQWYVAGGALVSVPAGTLPQSSSSAIAPPSAHPARQRETSYSSSPAQSEHMSEFIVSDSSSSRETSPETAPSEGEMDASGPVSKPSVRVKKRRIITASDDEYEEDEENEEEEEDDAHSSAAGSNDDIDSIAGPAPAAEKRMKSLEERMKLMERESKDHKQRIEELTLGLVAARAENQELRAIISNRLAARDEDINGPARMDVDGEVPVGPRRAPRRSCRR